MTRESADNARRVAEEVAAASWCWLQSGDNQVGDAACFISGWDLHVAAQLGDVETLQQATAGEVIARNERGWSPVMFAVASGYREAVNTLLAVASDIEEARTQVLETAVHYDDLELISSLLQQGAVGPSALSAGLLHAVTLGNMRMAHFLLTNGADVNFTDAEGTTAMSLATERGDRELITLLFSATLRDTPRAKQRHKAGSWGVAEFCRELAAHMDTYSSSESLHDFLRAVALPELWPTFQLEEVDLGVLLDMTDEDLLLIGVTSSEAREIILRERDNVKSYMERLFGAPVAARLFACDKDT